MLVKREPWWQRLGPSFRGTANVDFTLSAPPSPATPVAPQRLRKAAGLAPLKSSRCHRRAQTARSAPSHSTTVIEEDPFPPTPAKSSTAPAPQTSTSSKQPSLEPLEVYPPIPQADLISNEQREQSPPSTARSQVLRKMDVDELMEANIERALLPSTNIIVRSHLTHVMETQTAIYKSECENRKDTLDKLKQRQVAWRRKHDALVKRRRQNAARFMPAKKKASGEDTEEPPDSDQPKMMAHKRMQSRSKDGATTSPRPTTSRSSSFGSESSLPGSHLSSPRRLTIAVVPSEDSMGSVPNSSSPQHHRGSSAGGVYFETGGIHFPGTTPTSTTAEGGGRRQSLAPGLHKAIQSAPGSRRTSQNTLVAHTLKISQDPGRRSSFGEVRSWSRRGTWASDASATSATAPEEPEKFGFTHCVALAKRHNFRCEEVKELWDKFHMYDKNGSQSLCMDEFQRVIRSMCGIPDAEPIPHHLFNACWSETDTNGDGEISFEEFVLWSIGVQYSEEMMVKDPEERMLRSIARDHGLELHLVERLKAPFDKYDPVHIGITEKQFHDLVCDLLHTDDHDFSECRMRRNWNEVSHGRHGGRITFNDFAVWWNRSFDENGEPIQPSASLAVVTPTHNPKRNSMIISASGGLFPPSDGSPKQFRRHSMR